MELLLALRTLRWDTTGQMYATTAKMVRIIYFSSTKNLTLKRYPRSFVCLYSSVVFPVLSEAFTPFSPPGNFLASDIGDDNLGLDEAMDVRG